MRVRTNERGFLLNGTISKHRTCELVELTAYLSNSKIYNKPHKITPSSSQNIHSRIVSDDQQFEDWLVETETVIPTHMSLYARFFFLCNPFWYTISKIDEFTIEYSDNETLEVHRY